MSYSYRRPASEESGCFLPPLIPSKHQDERDTFPGKPPSSKSRSSSRPLSEAYKDEPRLVRPKSSKHSPRQATTSVKLPKINTKNNQKEDKKEDSEDDENSNEKDDIIPRKHSDEFSKVPVLPSIKQGDGDGLHEKIETMLQENENVYDAHNKSVASTSDRPTSPLIDETSIATSGTNTPKLDSRRNSKTHIVENIASSKQSDNVERAGSSLSLLSDRERKLSGSSIKSLIVENMERPISRDRSPILDNLENHNSANKICESTEKCDSTCESPTLNSNERPHSQIKSPLVDGREKSDSRNTSPILDIRERSDSHGKTPILDDRERSDSCGKSPILDGRETSDSRGKSPILDDRERSDSCGKSPLLEVGKRSDSRGKSPLLDGRKRSDSSGKSPILDGRERSDSRGKSPLLDSRQRSDSCGKSPILDNEERSDSRGKSPLLDGPERSDSPCKSPLLDGRERSDSRGKSPILDDRERSDSCGKSPLLVVGKRSDSRGKSPLLDGRQRSDSSGKSPILDGRERSDSRGKSPILDGRERSDSSGKSPILDNEERSDSRGKSPLLDGPETSDSPCKSPLLDGRERSDSRGKSPILDDKERSDSRKSPLLDGQERSNSHGKSPLLDGRERSDSRGKSPILDNKERSDSRGKSPLLNDKERLDSRGKSPLLDERERCDSRGNSPLLDGRCRSNSCGKSPLLEDRKKSDSRGKSPILDNKEKSDSCGKSPLVDGKERSDSRGKSPILDDKERSDSPGKSPVIDGRKRSFSRGKSPILHSKERHSSPILDGRESSDSRGKSPIIGNDEQPCLRGKMSVTEHQERPNSRQTPPINKSLLPRNLEKHYSRGKSPGTDNIDRTESVVDNISRKSTTTQSPVMTIDKPGSPVKNRSTSVHKMVLRKDSTSSWTSSVFENEPSIDGVRESEDRTNFQSTSRIEPPIIEKKQTPCSAKYSYSPDDQDFMIKEGIHLEQEHLSVSQDDGVFSFSHEEDTTHVDDVRSSYELQSESGYGGFKKIVQPESKTPDGFKCENDTFQAKQKSSKETTILLSEYSTTNLKDEMVSNYSEETARTNVSDPENNNPYSASPCPTESTLDGDEEIIYNHTSVVNIAERYTIEVYRSPSSYKPKRKKTGTIKKVNEYQTKMKPVTTSSDPEGPLAPAIQYSTATTIVAITEPGIYNHGEKQKKQPKPTQHTVTESKANQKRQSVCENSVVTSTESHICENNHACLVTDNDVVYANSKDNPTSTYCQTEIVIEVERENDPEDNERENKKEDHMDENRNISDPENDNNIQSRETLVHEKMQGYLIEDEDDDEDDDKDDGDDVGPPVISSYTSGKHEKENIKESSDSNDRNRLLRSTSPKSDKNFRPESSHELVYSKESLIYTVGQGSVEDQWATEDYVDVVAKILADIAITRVLNEPGNEEYVNNFNENVKPDSNSDRVKLKSDESHDDKRRRTPIAAHTGDEKEAQLFSDVRENLVYEEITANSISDRNSPVPVVTYAEDKELDHIRNEKIVMSSESLVFEEIVLIVLSENEGQGDTFIYSRETKRYIIDKGYVEDAWSTEDFIDVTAKAMVDIALTRVLNEDVYPDGPQPGSTCLHETESNSLESQTFEPDRAQHTLQKSNQDELVNNTDMSDERTSPPQFKNEVASSETLIFINSVAQTLSPEEESKPRDESTIYSQESLLHTLDNAQAVDQWATEDDIDVVAKTLADIAITRVLNEGQNGILDSEPIIEGFAKEKTNPLMSDEQTQNNEKSQNSVHKMPKSDENSQCSSVICASLTDKQDNYPDDFVSEASESLKFENIIGNRVNPDDEQIQDGEPVVYCREIWNIVVDRAYVEDEWATEDFMDVAAKQLVDISLILALNGDQPIDQEPIFDETAQQKAKKKNELDEEENVFDESEKRNGDERPVVCTNSVGDDEQNKSESEEEEDNNENGGDLQTSSEALNYERIETKTLSPDESEELEAESALNRRTFSDVEEENNDDDLKTSSETLKYEEIIMKTLSGDESGELEDGLVYSKEVKKYIVDKNYVEEQVATEDFVDVVAKILVDIALTRVLNEDIDVNSISDREAVMEENEYDKEHFREKNEKDSEQFNGEEDEKDSEHFNGEADEKDSDSDSEIQKAIEENKYDKSELRSQEESRDQIVKCSENQFFEHTVADTDIIDEDEIQEVCERLTNEHIRASPVSPKSARMRQYAASSEDDDYRFGLPIKCDQFYLEEDVAFLNHGSFGAVPKDVVAELEKVIKEHEANPDVWERVKWQKYHDESLKCVADFIGADKKDVAFVESTIRGIKRIFAATDIENDDEIIVNNWTVKGVRKVVNTVCKIFTGVHCTTLVHDLPIKDPDQILDQYRTLLLHHKKVKMVIVDHVASAPSVLFPIKELVEICHAHGILVVVNGAHAPGHIPLNIKKLNPDFYVGNLSKWAFAPNGCAFIWTHPTHRAQMIEIKHLFKNDREISKNPFFTAKHALKFMAKIGGMDKITAYNSYLLDTATDMLADAWKTSIMNVPQSMEAPFMRCVLLPHLTYVPRTPEGANEVFKALWNKYKIWAPVFCCGRKLYVRISAQVYCVHDDYVRLRDAVLSMVDMNEEQMEEDFVIQDPLRRDSDVWSLMSVSLSA